MTDRKSSRVTTYTVFDKKYYKDWKYEERPYGTDKTYFAILCWANKFASFNLFSGKGKKALDIGCGLGHLVYMLATYGYDTYALDKAQYPVEKGRENLVNLLGQDCSVNFMVHDVHDPLSIKGFDVIFSMRALEHFMNPIQALTNIYNALKPRGALVFWTSNRFALHRWFLHRNPTHVNVKTSIEWGEIFQSFRPHKL